MNLKGRVGLFGGTFNPLHNAHLAVARKALDQYELSGVVFIPTAGCGETPLVHGRNIATLLKKRIILMERHFDDEPRIDPDYVMKRSAEAIR